jgi:hypothetical protein
MASKLTQLAQQKTAAELQTMSREAMNWLMKKLADIRNPSTIPGGMNREKFRQTNQFMLGGLYCFYYDPKTKADLPYYDVFPLTLVLERYNDGFLGLNFHYLPLRYRLAFMTKLLDFATYDSKNDIQRLRVTYDILSASKRLKEFKPCIKRYLTNQIQSRMLAIQPNEWDVAAFLPIQQFKGARASRVWQESVEEIRN